MRLEVVAVYASQCGRFGKARTVNRHVVGAEYYVVVDECAYNAAVFALHIRVIGRRIEIDKDVAGYMTHILQEHLLTLVCLVSPYNTVACEVLIVKNLTVPVHSCTHSSLVSGCYRVHKVHFVSRSTVADIEVYGSTHTVACAVARRFGAVVYVERVGSIETSVGVLVVIVEVEGSTLT